MCVAVTFTNNTSVHGYGGAAFLGTGYDKVVPLTAAQVQICLDAPMPVYYYRDWDYNCTIVMKDCIIAYNSAPCRYCGGGGFAISPGGVTRLENTTVEHNFAG